MNNSPLAIKRRRLAKEWTPEITQLRKKAHRYFDSVFPNHITGYQWLRDNFSSEHFAQMTKAELETVIKKLK